LNFQNEIRNAKQVIRAWVGANFSDEKLAGVSAFNADGKMSFRNPCSCLLGVTYSDRLHTCQDDCSREHYQLAWRQDMAQRGRFASLFSSSRMGNAEKAYIFLGLSNKFDNCFGDDDLRRRRLSALLRAEMRCRDRRLVFGKEEPAAVVASC
jgi:hypothetical protein